MKIELASLNFKNNKIEEREKFAFSKEKIRKILCEIKKDPSVRGCVLLATCNRTELYISREQEKEDENMQKTAKGVEELLLSAAEVTDFCGSFDRKEGREAVYYLTELASGLKSQILGEGQIVTQIGAAWQTAKEENCTDSVLNVLFQNAVAAGKKVLTRVKISAVPLSSAYAAFELIMKYYGSLSGRKAMIIGNGNMGKLMQELLHEEGCDVVVTIRGYSHGNNEVVKGCRKIAYVNRYEYMEQCDFVVSATRSPHRTVLFEKVKLLRKIPDLMIDLAMPRDIDAEIQKLCCVKNINELGFQTDVDRDTLNRIYAIIEEYVEKFYHWYSYEEALEEIDLLKRAMARRIAGSFKKEGIETAKEERIVELAVEQSVKMLVGGMHEFVDSEKIRRCRKKIEMHTRG